MWFLRSCIVWVFLTLTSCASIDIGPKFGPEYQGIDPEFVKLHNEYHWLAAQYNIKFKRNVTMGFKNIRKGSIVGMCTYGIGFREIDIDINYWNHSTNTSKTILLFHELNHCYCGRDHDFGDGERYPEHYIPKSLHELHSLIVGKTGKGYFDDSCPISLMYPSVLEDYCANAHYADYIKEMFQRCIPW